MCGALSHKDANPVKCQDALWGFAVSTTRGANGIIVPILDFINTAEAGQLGQTGGLISKRRVFLFGSP